MGQERKEQEPGINLPEVGKGILIDGEEEDDYENKDREADRDEQPFPL
jgi:hypothetical protein